MKRRKTYAFPPKLQRRFSDASLEVTSILLSVCYYARSVLVDYDKHYTLLYYAGTPSFENAE